MPPLYTVGISSTTFWVVSELTSLEQDILMALDRYLWTHVRADDREVAILKAVPAFSIAWSQGKVTGWVQNIVDVTIQGITAHDIMDAVTSAVWKVLILYTIRRCGGNQSMAAKILGMDRICFRRYCSDEERRKASTEEGYEDIVLECIRCRQHDRQDTGGIGVDQLGA